MRDEYYERMNDEVRMRAWMLDTRSSILDNFLLIFSVSLCSDFY